MVVYGYATSKEIMSVGFITQNNKTISSAVGQALSFQSNAWVDETIAAVAIVQLVNPCL